MSKILMDLNTTCWYEIAKHQIRMHSFLRVDVHLFLLIVLAGHPVPVLPCLEIAPY